MIIFSSISFRMTILWNHIDVLLELLDYNNSEHLLALDTVDMVLDDKAINKYVHILGAVFCHKFARKNAARAMDRMLDRFLSDNNTNNVLACFSDEILYDISDWRETVSEQVSNWSKFDFTNATVDWVHLIAVYSDIYHLLSIFEYKLYEMASNNMCNSKSRRRKCLSVSTKHFCS